MDLECTEQSKQLEQPAEKINKISLVIISYSADQNKKLEIQIYLLQEATTTGMNLHKRYFMTLISNYY
jgi:hypothetical protein